MLSLDILQAATSGYAPRVCRFDLTWSELTYVKTKADDKATREAITLVFIVDLLIQI